MSKIVFNPNSIFTNSPANFIINKDAMYAFTRTISSLNNSVWGIQPTREQYISGITIDEISANHSLCSDVYFLNDSVDALKFFAQRPFIKCESIEERDRIATNPLAVYLTPLEPIDPTPGRSISKRKLMNNLKDIGIWDQVVEFLQENGYWDDFDHATTLDENEALMQAAITALKDAFSMDDASVEELLANSVADAKISDNDCYEWIFCFNDDVSWDYIKQYADGKHFLSDAVEESLGKWELIGSTSMTDDKISAILQDVYNTIDSVSADLSNAISSEIDRASIAEEYLSNVLSTEIEDREVADANLANLISEVSTDLSTEIEERKTADNGIVELIEDISSDLSDAIYLLSSSLSAEISNEIDRAETAENALQTALLDEVAAREAADNAINDSLSTLSDLIEDIEGGEIEKIGVLSDAIDNLNDALIDETDRAEAVEQEISSMLSTFALSTVVAEAYRLSVGEAEEHSSPLTSDNDEFIYRFFQGGHEVGHINVPQDQFVVSAAFSGTILILELRNGQKISTDLKDVVDILTGDSGEATRVSVYIDPDTNIVSAALLDDYVLQEDFQDLTANVAEDVNHLSDALTDLNDALTNLNDTVADLNNALTAETTRAQEAENNLSSTVDSNFLHLSGGTLTGNLTIKPGNKATIFDGEKIYRQDGSASGKSFVFPNKGGTFALTSDIADLSSTVSTLLSNDFVKKSDVYNAIVTNISGFNEYLDEDTIPGNISAIVEWNRAFQTALLAVANL